MVVFRLNQKKAVVKISKYILCGGLAGLSCQRFLLPEIYALSPFIVLGFYWMHKIRSDKSDPTYLLIAMLMCVDNGGDIYAETPVVIRYLIYVSLMWIIIPRERVKKSGVLFLLSLYFIMTFQMLFGIDTIRMLTINENIIQLSIFSIFVLTVNFKIYGDFDTKLIVCFLMIYLLFESLNYIFFYEAAMGYMNYNSTKALLVLPFLYFLKTNKLLLTILSSMPTTMVLIANGTRFIPVMFVMTLVLILFKKFLNLKFTNKIMLLILNYFLGEILFWYSDKYELEASKVTNFFYQVATNFSIDVLRILEPVRMDENYIFFSRSVYEILFGSGLGSGLWDKNNTFGYIDYSQYAFSRMEIDSHIYHGLHDFWTDIGLRFGMLFVSIIVLMTIKNIWKYEGIKGAYWAMCLILLFCSFYSTAGVLLISIIYGLAMYLEKSAS